jgi:hypothetical protein
MRRRIAPGCGGIDNNMAARLVLRDQLDLPGIAVMAMA